GRARSDLRDSRGCRLGDGHSSSRRRSEPSPGRPRRALTAPEARCYILPRMFKRQTTGSVVCASCGYLVGVNDATCYNCGRRNPGLWGFAPVLRSFGKDLGFVPFVTGTCIALYALGLLASGRLVLRGGLIVFL